MGKASPLSMAATCIWAGATTSHSSSSPEQHTSSLYSLSSRVANPIKAPDPSDLIDFTVVSCGFGFVNFYERFQDTGTVSIALLWIWIRKGPKLFAGSGSVIRSCGFGFVSGFETGLEPHKKNHQKISNLLKMTLKIH
jgi:hypothetical protein